VRQPARTIVRHSPRASSEAARKRMRACRGRDTAPERDLRSALHRMGLRFRVHRRPEPAINCRADILFSGAKLAVFVDGCFWHGCPQHRTTPRANRRFWLEKIAANRRRDARSARRIRSAGWTVIRVWEHETSQRAGRRIAERLASCYDRTSGARGFRRLVYGRE
jgi:DNA mismatch endonuclease, patch repair protein